MVRTVKRSPRWTSPETRYITAEEHAELAGLSQEIGRMLGSMIKNPASFLIPNCRSDR